MKHIQILIPKGRPIVEGFAFSFISTLLYSQNNGKFTFGLSIKEQPFVTDEFDDNKYKRIAEAREELVQDAIDSNADYVLFLDDDTVFPINAIESMFDYDLDFVSALNFAKKPPFMPTIFTSNFNRKENTINQRYKHILDYPEALIEVEGVGLFCALIKVDAIKKIRKPYFASPELDLASNIGEDISFCRRFWEAGLKIYVDTTLKCGHIYKDKIVTEKDFLNKKELAYDYYAQIQ